MKPNTEPTHLEFYQQQRIIALEKEVERLKKALEPAHKYIGVVDINDPVFDRPIQYEIVTNKTA